jgi:hypothetical protein
MNNKNLILLALVVFFVSCGGGGGGGTGIANVSPTVTTIVGNFTNSSMVVVGF